VYSDKV